MTDITDKDELEKIFDRFEQNAIGLMTMIAGKCDSSIYPGWSRGLSDCIRMSDVVDLDSFTVDQLFELKNYAADLRKSCVLIGIVVEALISVKRENL